MKKICLLFVFMSVNVCWSATINLTWDGENITPASCTYGGTFIPPTPPTRTGYIFAGWKVKTIVNSSYTKLEYIEGGKNLNAYINLGYAPTPTMKTLLIASIGTQYVGGDQILLGSSEQTAFANGKPYAIDIHYNNVFITNGDYQGTSTSRLDIVLSLNTVYQFKLNYPTVGTIGVDNTTKTSYTNITSVASRNLYLFGFNGNNAYSSCCSVLNMKLYELTLWDNNTTIHHYIPARRNSDNVLGIYDTVTQTFLTNNGTGSFIAGPDIGPLNQ